MFAHAPVFLSSASAIAITHPLTSVTELIQARERVRRSGMLLCWIAAGVLLLTMKWLVLFGWCSLSAIRPEAGAPVDMPAFLGRNRVQMQLAFVAFACVGIGIDLIDMATPGLSADAARGRIVNGGINGAVIVVALFVRARWLQ